MSTDGRTNETINAVFTVALLIFGFGTFALAQSVTKGGENTAAREKLIGAWHLVHIDVPGPDGKPIPIPQPTGMRSTRAMDICPCN